MTLMQDVRATIPGLREAMPDLRVAMPDLRDVTSGLREAMPDARAAMPSIREGIADLRADLPGPWRPERRSLAGRAAIALFAALAVTVVAWGVIAFVDRRRSATVKARTIDEERQALMCAEDEGMGMAIGAPVMGSTTTQAGTITVPRAGQSRGSSASGMLPTSVAPMVGVPAGGVEGGDPDGR